MKYQLVISGWKQGRHLVLATIDFPTKKAAEKFIAKNILAYSLDGKSFSLYVLE